MQTKTYIFRYFYQQKLVTTAPRNRGDPAAPLAAYFVATGIVKCPLPSPSSLLPSLPPSLFLLAGPYTCLRTVGHRSVAMLRFHLTRLWESACATGLGSAVRLEGRQSLDRRTTDAIAKATEAFFLGEVCCVLTLRTKIETHLILILMTKRSLYLRPPVVQ